MKKNVTGLELSKEFSEELVKPILHKYFPKLSYSIALIGYGSEVLGYDTFRSKDHAWGPRALVFLREQDFSKYRAITKALSDNLPYTFRGYYTSFGKPDKHGVRHMELVKSGPVNHKIDIFTVKRFFNTKFGIEYKSNLKPVDWLLLPQQKLLEITSGEAFYDGNGELSKMRKQLEYLPKDVWLYVLASQWKKISQEEAFVGRTGEVGDELGSQIIATRLVRELMILCFLLEKRYFPYSKWFGSAFKELHCSKRLSPIFRSAASAQSWKVREKHLVRAYSIIADLHNKLHITKKLPTKAVKYHNRPFKVIRADMFAESIRVKIRDKKLRNLELAGSVDQFTESAAFSHMPNLLDHLKVHLSSMNALPLDRL